MTICRQIEGMLYCPALTSAPGQANGWVNRAGPAPGPDFSSATSAGRVYRTASSSMLQRARPLTLLHRCARKADGSSENPTTARQHDIKIQESAVRAQPGDARGSAVRSWVLDGHRRAGWQMGMVVPRGETSETPDPVLQRGPPDLVVIPRRGGVCKEQRGEHVPLFVRPRVLILNPGKIPSPIFEAAGS